MNINRLTEIQTTLSNLDITEQELTEFIQVANLPVDIEQLATKHVTEFTQDFTDLVKSTYKEQFSLDSVLHSADWDKIWEYIDTYGIERKE